MENIKLIVPYLFSLLLLCFGAFCLFEPDIVPLGDESFCIYIRASAIFIITTAFFLSWYYANIIIRRETYDEFSDFGVSIINFDLEKISRRGLIKIAEEKINEISEFENCRFELLGFCLPFLMLFLAGTFIGIAKNPNSFLAYLLACLLSFIIIKFAGMISDICSIRRQKNNFINITRTLARSIRGIQFYNAKNFIKDKINETKSEALKETEQSIHSLVMRTFYCAAGIFVGLILIYLSNGQSLIKSLVNMQEIEEIYVTTIFLFVMSVASFFKSLGHKKSSSSEISKYELPTKSDRKSSKKIKDQNLFIAFHGVYFQDPTKISDHPIIQDLSFSVLPGEFITITGENTKARDYIFDLLLKFYKPQSGQIYVAGTKIDAVPREDIRQIVGVFEEDFALINGTIYENLQLVEQDNKKLRKSEKILPSYLLKKQIFDKDGTINITQAQILQLQIARLSIQDPQLILIKTPATFESEEAEKIFYDFLDYSIERKTIIMISDNISSIIYSNKILYLSKDLNLFGTHAELSRNKRYQQFIGTL